MSQVIYAAHEQENFINAVKASVAEHPANTCACKIVFKPTNSQSGDCYEYTLTLQHDNTGKPSAPCIFSKTEICYGEDGSHWHVTEHSCDPTDDNFMALEDFLAKSPPHQTENPQLFQMQLY